LICDMIEYVQTAQARDPIDPIATVVVGGVVCANHCFTVSSFEKWNGTASKPMVYFRRGHEILAPN